MSFWTPVSGFGFLMDSDVMTMLRLGEDSVCEFATPSRMRIIDRRGEGIPVIMSDTGKLSGLVPRYRLLDDSELMLTIPSAPIDDRVKLHQLVKDGLTHRKGDGINMEDGINDGIKVADDGITPADEGIKGGIKAKISVAVKKHPGIRVPELVLLVGKSKPTIERAVSQLKKEGTIEYRGSKKTGGYYLALPQNDPTISNQ